MSDPLPPLVTARWDVEKAMVRLTICDDTGVSATLFLALETLAKLRNGVQAVIDEVNRRAAEQMGRQYQPAPDVKQ